MSKSLTVVAYVREEHEPGLMRFTEKVLGPEICERRRKITESFHERMPGRDRTPLRHIILDGDRVVGTLGYMPADFLVKGERVPVRFTHDLLVDPDYRGGGLGKLLVQNAQQLGDFFPGGMWMTNPCYKIHLGCGFDDAAPLTTCTSVLDPASFLRRRDASGLGRLVGRLALDTTRRVALRRARRIARRSSGAIKAVDRFDPSLDPIWLKLAGSYQVTRVRDAAYLNWKYADHPILNHRILIAMRGESAAGYAIWRPAPNGVREQRAAIPDFLVEKGDRETLQRLAARILVDASEAGIDAVAILTTQAWASAVLRKLGFVPGKNHNTWVVAGWQGLLPAEWLTDHEPWHICLGDSDGDLWTGAM